MKNKTKRTKRTIQSMIDSRMRGITNSSNFTRDKINKLEKEQNERWEALKTYLKVEEITEKSIKEEVKRHYAPSIAEIRRLAQLPGIDPSLIISTEDTKDTIIYTKKLQTKNGK